MQSNIDEVMVVTKMSVLIMMVMASELVIS